MAELNKVEEIVIYPKEGPILCVDASLAMRRLSSASKT